MALGGHSLLAAYNSPLVRNKTFLRIRVMALLGMTKRDLGSEIVDSIWFAWGSFPVHAGARSAGLAFCGMRTWRAGRMLDFKIWNLRARKS